MKTRTRDERPFRSLALPLLGLGALVAGCGGGGGGGGGSASSITESEAPGATGGNDTPATADALAVAQPVRGDVSTAGDIDTFSIPLNAGHVIQIELFATRSDQTSWDAASNVPRLTLYDTDANANAKLQQHDFSGTKSNGWPAGGGSHDLDLPMFLVPASGTYFVAVTQDDTAVAGGRYVLKVHDVTVTNLQEEAEPSGADGANDTPGTAELITPGTVHGYHLSGGFDYYKFAVAAGTTVSLEMTAFRNGLNRGDPDYFDPNIHLYDIDGTTLLVENDDTYFYDSAIQYRITSAGTYFVQIEEFSAANSEYFLTLSTSTGTVVAESEPNDDTATADTLVYGGLVSGDIDDTEVDFFKFTGTKGDMIRLQRFDAGNLQGAADVFTATLLAPDGTTPLPVNGDFVGFQTQNTILQETGTFYVKVEPVALPVPTNYLLKLTLFKASTYEVEANDTIATANALGTRSAGVIDPVTDADVYSLSIGAKELAHLVCYASKLPTDSDGSFEYSGHGSTCSPLLEVLDGTGAVVATSTSTPAGVFTESVTDPLPTCAVAVVPDTGGTYYLRVTDAAGGGGPGFYYVVEKR